MKSGIRTLNSEGGQFPKGLFITVLSLSVLPFVLSLLGADFRMRYLEVTEAFRITVTATILVSLFTGTLCLAHYALERNRITFILGVSLIGTAVISGFQLFASYMFGEGVHREFFITVSSGAVDLFPAVLILAGVLDEQAEGLEATCLDHGLERLEQRQAGEWRALVLKSKPPYAS